MRILVADDSSEIRGALGLLLREMDRRDIVEASDVAEALEACDCPDGTAMLDLVLLDWELPPGAGRFGGAAGLVAALREAATGCRIIAMSARPEAEEESLRVGCDAFVSLTDPPDRLVALLAELATPGEPPPAD
jgi:CheY-like chemotaxis protein